MEHPYPFTVDLLKQVIGKAPVFFPAHRKKEMEDLCEKFKDDKGSSLADIEKAIVDFGREIWPYRKSFWSIHDTDGKPKEEQYLREEAKKEGIMKKYEEFLQKGGKHEDLKNGSQQFESFFSPEEKGALIRARLQAHTRLVGEIHDLCGGDRMNECTIYFARYKHEQAELDQLIAVFRTLAEKTKKYRDEILNRSHVFESGWSGVERETTRTEVEAAIEYYDAMRKSEGFIGK
ncbi:MAG: hypothetical protein Q7S16_04385 [bacterium]|nr:hypothetical protein [bacterium]